MADLMFAGIGGQGVLTAGKILMKIAAANGKNVCWTSEYSAEMRGGSALCRVVISDEDIGTPYPDVLDVLCCMTEGAYETYVGQVHDGGTVIVNSSLFGEREYPENLNVYGVDAMEIALEAENPRGANIAVLGAMIKATGMLEADKFEKTLEAYYEKKGKGNVKCFQLGYQRAEKL